MIKAHLGLLGLLSSGCACGGLAVVLRMTPSCRSVKLITYLATVVVD